MSPSLPVVTAAHATRKVTLPAATPIAHVSPVDLQLAEVVPPATAQEIRSAVDRARVAQARWQETPFAERVAAMKVGAKALLRRRAEAIALCHTEIGKSDIEGLFTETLGPLDYLSGWTRVLERHGQRQQIRLNPLAFPGKSAHIDLVPRGVVGVVAPWNFPVAGLYRALFPAILTGNAVVLKPSEFSPRSSQWLADVLASALPDGLLQVVHGDGAAGALLVESGIDACIFTGSPRSGLDVRVRCAELGIPSSLELGGKDAAIVLADCDLDRTLAGVTHWALSNAGQSCGAVEIALVEAHFADTFVERLDSAWRRLRIGPQNHAEIAPLANRLQFAIVQAHIRDAVAKGAQLVCGGAPTGEGLYFQPTILDHCTADMAVVRDETFGPVLAIVRVASAADAVARINKARYGLGASIWTSDLARAERLAQRLNVGVVTVNNHSFTGAIADLPWSGTRETGFGIAGSQHALGVLTRPRAVVIDRSTSPELFWMPFDDALWQLGQALADAQLLDLRNAWKIPLLMRERIATVKQFFRG